MIRWALIVAALSGLMAVAMGAIGAHALADLLVGRAGAIYDTANLYHFVHALALLLAALAPLGGANARLCILASLLWLAGLVLFSGSLYALALTGFSPLGAVAPLGGLSFLLGWVCLAWAGWRAGKG